MYQVEHRDVLSLRNQDPAVQMVGFQKTGTVELIHLIRHVAGRELTGSRPATFQVATFFFFAALFFAAVVTVWVLAFSCAVSFLGFSVAKAASDSARKSISPSRVSRAE